MKEYWVNVYDNGYGGKCRSRCDADFYAAPMLKRGRKLLYRIHVKMKEPEIPYGPTGLKGY